MSLFVFLTFYILQAATPLMGALITHLLSVKKINALR